jgi:thiol:disulfide interchange protein
MDNIAVLLASAFIGGVILNVMPCVLPVLTMKVFHVIEKAKEDPSVNRKHGLAYTAGIVAMFWVLAVVVIALKASGERMGWGMQFQNPAFVAVLIAIMVGFGLNALGVFEITVGMGDVETGEGYFGSFVNGVLASIMSTPCSAPFLGPAAAFAFLSGSPLEIASIFTLIGLGLAFPFLLISFVPAIGRVLPKPGPWMETFKQLMGFTLLAAALWFMGALQAQLTKDGLQMFLGFLLVMSVALWGMQRFGGFEHSNLRRRLVRLSAVLLTAAGAYFMVDLTPPKKPIAIASADPARAAAARAAVIDGQINWAPFDLKMVKASLDRGQPVFMDYTAEWCANCKTNEKLFIETKKIRADLTATNILPMKADYTSEDETIEEWMEKLGRAAIPIYVIYYPDGSYDLLPEVITTAMLSSALHKASSKYPPDKYKTADAAAAAKTAGKDDDGETAAAKSDEAG